MEKKLIFNFGFFIIFLSGINAQYLTKVDSLCIDEIPFTDATRQRYIYSHQNDNAILLNETSLSTQGINFLCRLSIIDKDNFSLVHQENRIHLAGSIPSQSDYFNGSVLSGKTINDNQCFYDMHSRVLYNNNEIIGDVNIIEKYCDNNLVKSIIIDSTFSSHANLLYSKNNFLYSFISDGNHIYLSVLNQDDEIIFKDTVNISPNYILHYHVIEKQDGLYLITFINNSNVSTSCKVFKITPGYQLNYIRDVDTEDFQWKFINKTLTTENNYLIINLNTEVIVMDPDFNTIEILSGMNTSHAHIFKYDSNIFALTRDRKSGTGDYQDLRIFKFNFISNTFDFYKVYTLENELESRRFSSIRIFETVNNQIIIAGSEGNLDHKMNFLILDNNLEKIILETHTIYGLTTTIEFFNIFTSLENNKLFFLFNVKEWFTPPLINQMWCYQFQFNDVTHIPTFHNPSFSLSPNPSSHHLQLQFKAKDFSQYQILDIQGRSLQQGAIGKNESNQQINVNDLKSGVYFIQLHGKNGTAVKKFLKQ